MIYDSNTNHCMRPATKNNLFARTFFISIWITLLILFFFQKGFAEPSKNKPESNLQLRKGPYLIFDGNSSQIKVLWQLYESSTCTIQWGFDTSYSIGSVETKEYGNDHQHSCTIRNLKPRTKYYYNVIVKNKDYTGTFYSAPASTAKRAAFIVYGDTRSSPTTHNWIARSIISSYTTDPSYQTFVLLTGDLVTYGADEFSWDKELFDSANISIRQMMRDLPFLTVLGNHEVYKKTGSSYIKSNSNVFKKYFSYPFVWGTCWAFDYGPVHIVFLDQYLKYQYLKYTDFIQLMWLKRNLAATNKQWKFVILHKPGWSAGDKTAHPDDKVVKKSIQPILEKYKVTALFAAHNHFYSRALVNGIYHITTGGGGAPFVGIDKNLPHILSAKRTHHYCKVEINDDVMKFLAVQPDGTIIDAFTAGANH